jgi:hypothetical protein
MASITSHKHQSNESNDNNELVSLFTLHRTGSDTWSCPIPIQLYSSPTPNTPEAAGYDPSLPVCSTVEVDITSTMVNNVKRWASKFSYTQGAFYFPPKFDSLKKTAEVDSYVRNACSHSLVEVVANGIRGFTGKDTATLNNLKYRYYFCRCGIAPTKTANRKTTHHHRTHRLLPGKKCPFKFRIFFDPDAERWFFPKEQGGSKEHRHHYQKTSLGSIVIPTSDISDHNKRVMMQMIALNFQVSQIGSWINIAQEFSITSDQVKGLYKYFKEGRYSHPSTDCLSGPAKNNIDSLLDSMTEDPKCSVIWISSSKEDAESLITIKTSKKRRQHDKKIQEMRDRQKKEQSSTQANSIMVEEAYDSSHLDEKKEDTPLKHSERILESLKLNQATRILLSLAWMDHSALEKMACFPFVLGMDETDRTNCEERPLFCMVGMDSSNHIFPVLHILMPSKARWAYSWIYNEAIPYLLPEQVRKNCQLLLTDQGKELVHTLSASVGNGNTFPGALHRLCAWHIVDRNYNMEVKKWVPAKKAQAEVDKKFISDICKWMYSFCTSIESKEHEKAHLQQLYLFIQLSRTSASVKKFTQKFIKKSFEEVLDKIVFYKYMYRIGGHVKVTSFVEAHNASLHVSATGPRPNHSLVTSVTRIRSNCNRKSKERKDLAERNADRRLTTRTGEDEDETTTLNHAALVLSPHLTHTTVDRIMQEWVCSSKFIYMKDESFTPSIDINGHEYNECYFVCWNPRVPRWCMAAIPSWAYIRKVFHVTFNGRRYLNCSCGHAHMFGSACRHMYSLLNRRPVPSDSSPRCMKLYSVQYWKNRSLTQAVDSYLKQNPFGMIPLQDDDELSTAESRGTDCARLKADAEYFQDWIQKTLSTIVAWPESPFYVSNMQLSSGTDENLGDVEEDQEQPYILQEQSGFDDKESELPDMPVFVVPGAPVLMATPQPCKLPPLSVQAVPPPRGATESLVQYKKRKRDEAIASCLRLVSKAKTVNEWQHIIDKCNHTQLELDSKHASSDAYNCIKDNLGGTISGCIPVTQSCNQGRLRKVNEIPSSTKKKLQF